MSKPPATLRTPVAPSRIADWLTTQLTRAKGFELTMQTMSSPQFVEAWPRPGEKLPKPSDLAAEIWEAAIEDSTTLGPLSGTPRYCVTVVPKDGATEAPRLGINVPLQPRDGTSGGAAFTPDAQGVVAQTLAHLASREGASQAMLIEGLEGLFTANKIQLTETANARKTDKEHFESVIEAYKSLLKAQNEGNAIAGKAAQEQIQTLADSYNSLQTKWLDVLPAVEDLYSQKHERELETRRAARADDRRDKLVADAQKLVFPIIASKLGIGGLLGMGAPAKAPAGTPPGPEVPPSSPRSSPGPPDVMQATIFGARTLRACEAFLASIETVEQFEAIKKVVNPKAAAILDELGASLMADSDEIIRRQETMAAANTASANANGAAS